MRSPLRDGAQTPTASQNPSWGLHLLDANLTLGNLIAIVHEQSAAYAQAARHYT